MTARTGMTGRIIAAIDNLEQHVRVDRVTISARHARMVADEIVDVALWQARRHLERAAAFGIASPDATLVGIPLWIDARLDHEDVIYVQASGKVRV